MKSRNQAEAMTLREIAKYGSTESPHGTCRHDAPAPIGREAQPAADSRARKAAKAMKGSLLPRTTFADRGRPHSYRENFRRPARSRWWVFIARDCAPGPALFGIALARIVSACTLGLWAFAGGLLIGAFVF